MSIKLGPAVPSVPVDPVALDAKLSFTELERAFDSTANPVGLVKKSGVTTVGAAVVFEALNAETILSQNPPPTKVFLNGSERFIVNEPLFRFLNATFFSPSKYVRTFVI